MYLERLLGALRGYKRIAIITHRHADLDAIGCANVLRDVLSALGYDAVVVCPEGAAREARQYADCVGEVPPGLEAAVLVDVATLAQVPRLDVPYAVVDHHVVGDEIPGVRAERPSCSEIALRIAEEAGVKPKRESLIAASLGIYADSVKLLKADGDTLRTLASAVDEIGPLEQYLGKSEENPSLKMAKIKALSRLHIYETKSGVVCATHVDAYESDVANMLVSAGCDVAVVASRHGGEVRAVFRSPSVNVAELAAKAAELLGGRGGGHRGAAALAAARKLRKDELPALLEELVRLIDASAMPLR
nr:MAG: exopolyphosphatase [Thermoproteus sp. AZ2]